MAMAVGLKAQPSTTPAPAIQPAQGVSAPTPAPGSAAEKEVVPPQAAPVLFHIGPLPVTNSMVCTWIVAAVILVIVRVTTWKNIKEIPSGMQNVIEALVEGWEGLMGDILDPRVTRWVFPFATTFFIFIIMSNFVDVIPGVGSIGVGTPVPHSSLPFAVHMQKPFFRPPTTDANLTVAMAGIFLVMSLFWAVRYNGFWGLIKHIFGVKMETSKWLLSAVSGTVPVHRRDGTGFHSVRPAGGVGHASLWEHFCRRNHPGHDAPHEIVALVYSAFGCGLWLRRI